MARPISIRTAASAPRILLGRVRRAGRGESRRTTAEAGGAARHGRTARTAAAAAGLVALGALGLLMLVPTLLGYQRYVIEGGSMGSALPKGSIAYEQTVPTAQLKRGDVITYRPPGGAAPRTHRIIGIEKTPNGERLYKTKGDANNAPDRPAFTLPHKTQARVTMHIPLAGYAIEALAIRAVRMVTIGIPAATIALITLTSLWRERKTTPAFG